MNTPLPGHLATHGLVRRLWPHGDTLDGLQVHAIVDAAQDPSIVAMVRTTGLERTCLFSGVLSPELEAAAPFLVHLSPTAPFTRCLFEQGWQAVGTSPEGMRLRVKDEAAIMSKIISTKGIKLQ